MILLILGVLTLLTGFIIKKSPEFYRYARATRMAGAAILLVAVLVKSFVQIDAGQIGVKVLFGKVQNDVLGSGLHMINPLMEIRSLDVKTQNYTMSGVQ